MYYILILLVLIYNISILLDIHVFCVYVHVSPVEYSYMSYFRLVQNGPVFFSLNLALNNIFLHAFFQHKNIRSGVSIIYSCVVNVSICCYYFLSFINISRVHTMAILVGIKVVFRASRSKFGKVGVVTV